MLFTYRVTAGQENVVAGVVYNKARKEQIPLHAVAVLEGLKGYILVEAADEVAVRQAAQKVPHIKGILTGTIQFRDIEHLLEVKLATVPINRGDIVELISGPFKGERAKVIRVEEGKEELTVELVDVAVPIPVTVKRDSVRMFQREDKTGG